MLYCTQIPQDISDANAITQMKRQWSQMQYELKIKAVLNSCCYQIDVKAAMPLFSLSSQPEKQIYFMKYKFSEIILATNAKNTLKSSIYLKTLLMNASS